MKPKKKIKYRVGDIVLLKIDSFTHEQAAEIAQSLKKPVILLPDISDFSSISKHDFKMIMKDLYDKQRPTTD